MATKPDIIESRAAENVGKSDSENGSVAMVIDNLGDMKRDDKVWAPVNIFVDTYIEKVIYQE